MEKKGHKSDFDVVVTWWNGLCIWEIDDIFGDFLRFIEKGPKNKMSSKRQFSSWKHFVDVRQEWPDHFKLLVR